MPKVDLEKLPTYDGSGRADAVAGPLGAYVGRAISGVYGLKNLGANVEQLMPGSSSSHRHWHDLTDELVVVLSGELTLIEEDGETLLRAGDIAAFPAGVENGHCLRNNSIDPATFLVVGTRHPDDRCHYSDVDLILHPGGVLTRRDGALCRP